MLRPLVLTASLSLLSLSAVAAPDGVKVYNQNCAMCHNAGLAKAPKFGDKEAWEARLAAGQPALLQSVMQGKGAMPPKGGNPKLSEEEVSAALSHMIAAAK